MKKFISFGLALMMVLSMAACGNSGSSSQSGSETAPSTTESAPSGDAAAPSDAADANQITKAEDLAGKVIGVQDGTTGQTYVEENANAKEVQAYKSGMDAALELKNGKIDAVVLDELPAKKIVEQNPDLYILDVDLATEEYAIAVKKGNTELVDSINATIKRCKEDGTYDKLTEAFMPASGEITLPEKVAAEGDKVLKLGTNAAFPPFEYAEGAEVVGFDISMGEQIAKDYGAKLQVEDMAFDSLISALQAGAVDFIAAGMSVTEERKQNVDFSDPYYSSRQVIILKK